MPVARLPGADLYYEVRGTPDSSRPAVLLLHGLGASSADWMFQFPALEPHHRIVAPDLPAHGRSSRPRGRLTVDAMADAVAGLLVTLAESPVHAVGLSLGGCVALALAVRAPARIRSLTLINTFARLRPAGPRGALRMLVRLGLLATAPMPWVAAYVARGLFPKPEQRDLYRAAVASLARNSRGAYFAALRALAAFDARPQLAGVRCPTLLIAGERDLTVPRAAVAALARGIPGARMLVLPDSGHASNYDQPALLNQTVLDFIAAH